MRSQAKLQANERPSSLRDKAVTCGMYASRMTHALWPPQSRWFGPEKFSFLVSVTENFRSTNPFTLYFINSRDRFFMPFTPKKFGLDLSFRLTHRSISRNLGCRFISGIEDACTTGIPAC